jgi:hypothetical protein
MKLREFISWYKQDVASELWKYSFPFKLIWKQVFKFVTDRESKTGPQWSNHCEYVFWDVTGAVRSAFSNGLEEYIV